MHYAFFFFFFLNSHSTIWCIVVNDYLHTPHGKQLSIYLQSIKTIRHYIQLKLADLGQTDGSDAVLKSIQCGGVDSSWW